MAPRPIFIHGAGGGVATWEHQEPAFEGCLALALPGHPAGTPMSSIGGYAEWTADAIADVEEPRVLVGHSMGGAVAMQVALDHPELVAGIVLVATGARLAVSPAAFTLAREDFTAACERLQRKGRPTADDATIAAQVAQMAAIGPDTLLADYAACAGFDVTDRLSEIAMPALVVCGQDDRLTPPSLADELGRGLRQAVVALVPDAGHWVMQDTPAAIDLLVAGFLARLELTDA